MRGRVKASEFNGNAWWQFIDRKRRIPRYFTTSTEQSLVSRNWTTGAIKRSNSRYVLLDSFCASACGSIFLDLVIPSLFNRYKCHATDSETQVFPAWRICMYVSGEISSKISFRIQARFSQFIYMYTRSPAIFREMIQGPKRGKKVI